MNNIFKTMVGTLLIAVVSTSCSKDDSPVNNVVGTGSIDIEFDNSFGSNDLILNNQDNISTNGEVLRISDVKYIVSNIVLTKADGTQFIYPKSESYFVVSEAEEITHFLKLKNIPAGDYTNVKFGIGVDREQFDQGASGQGDFLALAQEEGMMWSWSAGYKFLLFEGNFTAPGTPVSNPFMVHTGLTGTDYNYVEVSLPLPSKALVRPSITPDVHIIADVSKILNGENTISLSDNNSDGTGAMIMGGENLPLITYNLRGMFNVDHVHND